MWDLQTIVKMNDEAARRAPSSKKAAFAPRTASPDFVFKNPYDNVWLLAPQNEKARTFLKANGCPGAVYWSRDTAVVQKSRVDSTARWLKRKGFVVW